MNSMVIWNQQILIMKNYGDLFSLIRVVHLVNLRGITDVINFYFDKNILWSPKGKHC